MRIFVDKWTVKNYTKQNALWAMLSPKKPPFLEERKDIQADHPRDTGTSVYDTAKFDIDKYE